MIFFLVIIYFIDSTFISSFCNGVCSGVGGASAFIILHFNSVKSFFFFSI